mgnify:CR=1 FL=1
MIEHHDERRLDTGVDHLLLRWELQAFNALTRLELYSILAARIAVFVVEQDCPYPELDGRDVEALHLTAWLDDGEIAAYARILPPETRFAEPSIGRILTTRNHRGTGLGRVLVRRAIDATRSRFPDQDIRISAQRHLGAFYGSFGFEDDSEPYDEDGIPHVDMRLASSR